MSSFRRTNLMAGLTAITMASIAHSVPLTGPIVNPANNHSYFLLPNSTWTSAESQAVQIGGHLATVNTAAENQFIYSAFSNIGGISRNLWIGLHDPNPNINSTNRTTRRAEFVWTSGETPTYSNWSSVEPNNDGSGDPTPNPEYFVHIWQPGDFFAARWNNLRDVTSVFTVPLHGVVEIPALPGDANLDGLINRDDLAILDRGRALNLSGWTNGDFTADGAVTPADYAFLYPALSQPPAPTLIPEPASLIATPVLLLLRRTRKPPTLP